MRRTLDREFYRPRNTGVEPFTPEGTDLEVWSWEEEVRGNTRYFLTVFGGRRSKPDSNYWYKTRSHRDDSLDRIVRNTRETIKWKEERRASRKNPHSLKVGDLLKSSWGYDQTNVDFYEVVELNGKTMVTIEKIGGKPWKNTEDPESEYDDWYVSPNPEVRTGELSKHRVNPSSNSVRITSYANAYPTELGAKCYETPFYAGR